jgi:hypothetical protein
MRKSGKKNSPAPHPLQRGSGVFWRKKVLTDTPVARMEEVQNDCNVYFRSAFAGGSFANCLRCHDRDRHRLLTAQCGDLSKGVAKILE